MINLIEKKNQYTIILKNILCNSIFEGLQSIYNIAKDNNSSENILKFFQKLLKKIVSWDDSNISKEANRIISNNQTNVNLRDLLKATMKANIMILSDKTFIEPSYYMNIDFNNFIHTIYIECARNIWNNPYLFYHKYQSIEIKRNQREINILIKDSIEESIRKLLPLDFVVKSYIENDDNSQNLLNKYIKNDLSNQQINQTKVPNQVLNQVPNQVLNQVTNLAPTNQQLVNQDNLNNKYLKSLDSTDKQIQNKILNIIEDNKVNLTESNKFKSESSLIKQLSKEENTHKNISDNSNKTNEINDDIKNIIEKDLKNKKNISPNSNEYREIFSNSTQLKEINNPINNHTSSESKKTNDNLERINHSNSHSSLNSKSNSLANKNTDEKNNLKSKKKFFNNYLQF